MIEESSKPKTLVENAITLKASHFGKCLLYLEYGQNDHPEVKKGCFNIGSQVLIKFTFEPTLCADLMDLEIVFPNGRTVYQTLRLDWAQLHFGPRMYFACDMCGVRCDRLYVAQYDYFYCRSCQHLGYALQLVRKTTLGGLAYSLILAMKVEERKAQVKRVVYGGRMTRRAKAAMKLAQKSHSVVSRLRLTIPESQKISAV